MEKKELLYEGKAKKVYTTENPDVLIVDYKDDATAFNGVKKGTIVGKGVVNNRMTNHIFKMLEEKGIPTHFIEELSDRETAVKKVEIVPLEVIVSNEILVDYFKSIKVDLIDFKVEFGRYKGQIILADEISPDTCRFWDSETHEKLDKDRFRRDLGHVEEAYEEIYRRIGLA